MVIQWQQDLAPEIRLQQVLSFWLGSKIHFVHPFLFLFFVVVLHFKNNFLVISFLFFSYGSHLTSIRFFQLSNSCKNQDKPLTELLTTRYTQVQYSIWGLVVPVVTTTCVNILAKFHDLVLIFVKQKVARLSQKLKNFLDSSI